MSTKRERQAAEYAAEKKGTVDAADERNRRWRTHVTKHVDSLGIELFTLTGVLVTLDIQDYVLVGESLQTPAGWHTSEADALRDAAARVAEIHAAIGAQLARLLRGER